MSNQACRYCGLPLTDTVHSSGVCSFMPGVNPDAYVTITKKEYASLLSDRLQLQKIQGYIASYYATIPVCPYCNKRHQSKCAFDT